MLARDMDWGRWVAGRGCVLGDWLWKGKHWGEMHRAGDGFEEGDVWGDMYLGRMLDSGREWVMGWVGIGGWVWEWRWVGKGGVSERDGLGWQMRWRKEKLKLLLPDVTL